MWAIRTAGNIEVRERQIVYGALPAGAIEEASAIPLAEGVIYLANFAGGGHHGGSWFASSNGQLLFERGTGTKPRERLRRRLAELTRSSPSDDDEA